MAELQRASVTGGGLYERLLQRLALALDEADTVPSACVTSIPRSLSCVV